MYSFKIVGHSRSLCDLTESYKAQEQLHLLGPQQESTPPPPESNPVARGASSPLPEDDRLVPESDLAIVFPGEVHGRDDSVIKNSDQPGWFNIACTRDALAKLDLEQIAPHELADDCRSLECRTLHQTRRTAALKMITANYCLRSELDPKHDHAFTYEGNKIEIDFKDQFGNWRSSGPTSPFIEAIWDEAGALCLENTRLLKSSARTSIPWELLPKDCRSKNCDTDDSLIQIIIDECNDKGQLSNFSTSVLGSPHPIQRKCSGIKGGYFRTHPH